MKTMVPINSTMRRICISIFLLTSLLIVHVLSFTSVRRSSITTTTTTTTTSTRTSLSSPTSLFSTPTQKASQDLLVALESDPKDEEKIGSCIEELEKSAAAAKSDDNNNEPHDDDPPNFDPLIGLYEVSYTRTIKPNDNPVGGKWTRKSGIARKLLNPRRSFQHILPTNKRRNVVGEAVNVISLEAIWGFIRLTVILRGDAIPLSFEERTNTTRVYQPLTNLAVKAMFDPPRIIIGSRNGRISLLDINVGPKTTVLLDTLFCNDKLRLGMGGLSGSRFVFLRVSDDDVEANEFKTLIAKPTMKKLYTFSGLGIIATIGIAGVAKGILRFLSGTMATLALLLAGLIAFSGGGIEQGDRGITMRKEEEEAAAA